MPLYRFRCESCHHDFEELMSSREVEVATAVRCPSCESIDTHRELTTFAVRGSGAVESTAEPFCGRCGENRPPCGS